jgi:hypothetical protein
VRSHRRRMWPFVPPTARAMIRLRPRQSCRNAEIGGRSCRRAAGHLQPRAQDVAMPMYVAGPDAVHWDGTYYWVFESQCR